MYYIIYQIMKNNISAYTLFVYTDIQKEQSITKFYKK